MSASSYDYEGRAEGIADMRLKVFAVKEGGKQSRTKEPSMKQMNRNQSISSHLCQLQRCRWKDAKSRGLVCVVVSLPQVRVHRKINSTKSH